MMNNRTYGYMRYSDHKQDDGFSIEYQTHEITEYAKRNGLNLIKMYIDQAQTGTKVAGRDEFFALMNAVKAGEIDYIIVYKMNRIFRNSLESQKYRELMRKHKVKFISVTEMIDDETSSGRLTTNILADIDQYQSEIISDFVKSSMREMARQGFYTGGVIPYGFTLEEIQNGTKVRKKLVPLESEAAAVRKIYELYYLNHTYFYIQQYLNENGYLYRKGKPFPFYAIARILKAEIYIGTHIFKTKGYDPIVVKDCFTPIVDKELWYAIQAKNATKKLAKPRNRETGTGRRFHALTGFIKCSVCGGHYHGYASGVASTRPNDKERYYYTCSQKAAYRNCKSPNIRKEYIEKIALDAITKNILNEGMIKKLSKQIVELYDASPEEIDKKIKELKRQQNQSKERLKKLLDLVLSGMAGFDVLEDAKNEEQEKLEKITEQINQLEKQKEFTIASEDIEKYLYGMFAYLPTTQRNLLRAIFETFLDEIIISEKQIEIKLKVYASPTAVKETNSPPFIALTATYPR